MKEEWREKKIRKNWKKMLAMSRTLQKKKTPEENERRNPNESLSSKNWDEKKNWMYNLILIWKYYVP